MKLSVKAYKAKLTRADHKKMEKTLVDTCKVYKWLRKKYSKNEVRIHMKTKWCNIYQTFMEPEKNITLERLRILNDILPEKSLKEILAGLVPEYSVEWFMLGEDQEDMDILMNKFKS